ncbi:MAG TPA: hypothetical protein VGK23_08700 [Methanomassiliicoccales archaeon]
MKLYGEGLEGSAVEKDAQKYGQMLGNLKWYHCVATINSMNLKILVNAKKIAVINPPKKNGDLDVDAIVNSESITFLTTIKIMPLMKSKPKDGEEIVEYVDIELPPGGSAMLDNGTMIVNSVDPSWSDRSAYAFCPKCASWWVKKTTDRPKRCPNCMGRLDKFKTEELELEEVMKQRKRYFQLKTDETPKQ